MSADIQVGPEQGRRGKLPQGHWQSCCTLSYCLAICNRKSIWRIDTYGSYHRIGP